MSFYPITVNTPATEEAHIFAEDDAAIYQSIFGDDCVFDIGSCLKATVLSNNKVRVGDGVLAMGGHIGRNKYGDYEDLTILNGTSGQKRNDLIVARFATTGVGGVDTFTLAVKQGTPGTTAEDPAVTLGNLYEGASLREFPLYRVKLEGLSITAVEQLFKVRKTNGQLEEEIAELNRKSYADGYVFVDCGSLPNNTSKNVNIPLPANATNWWVSEAWFKHPSLPNFRYTLPHIDVNTYSNSVSIGINNNKQVSIATAANWTGYNAYAIVAYKL